MVVEYADRDINLPQWVVPDTMVAVSVSLRGVLMSLWPGLRRSSAGWMSASALRGIFEGQPSTTTPMPPPWLSPQVLMRKYLPKLLPMAVR